MTHDELEAIEAKYNRVKNHNLTKHNHISLTKVANNVPRLIAEVKSLKRENDALKDDLENYASDFCDICINYFADADKAPCNKCNRLSVKNTTSYWQWRGLQEADSGVKE